MQSYSEQEMKGRFQGFQGMLKINCVLNEDNDILITMENIKFYAITFLLVVGAGFLGYGAINSLRDPVYYVNNQTLTTVGDLKSQAMENPEGQNPVPVEALPTEPEPVPTAPVEPEQPVEPAPAPSSDLVKRLEAITVVLKKGSTGDDVKTLQEALNKAINAGLPVNGTFGPQTETAVKKFQTAQKISPVSGQVASKTIAALVAKVK
jgi:hypothetical protein